MFLKLEEKTMRIEEAQQEREIQMRHEEREFQLQMFHTLRAPLYQCGSSYPSGPSSIGFSQQPWDD